MADNGGSADPFAGMDEIFDEAPNDSAPNDACEPALAPKERLSTDKAVTQTVALCAVALPSHVVISPTKALAATMEKLDALDAPDRVKLRNLRAIRAGPKNVELGFAVAEIEGDRADLPAEIVDNFIIFPLSVEGAKDGRLIAVDEPTFGQFLAEAHVLGVAHSIKLDIEAEQYDPEAGKGKAILG